MNAYPSDDAVPPERTVHDARYELRRLDATDSDAIMHHRQSMFLEAGFPPSDVTQSMTHFGRWLEPRIRDGRYLGWGYVDERSRIAAGIGMIVMDWAPHPLHPNEDRRGYILNVYVERNDRRRGLAKALMLVARDEAVRRGIGFTTLHATEDGKLLYETLGWKPMSELFLRTSV